MKQTEELSLELMKVDKAEEARKARRDWLRLMKVSPGIWVKVEVSFTPPAAAEATLFHRPRSENMGSDKRLRDQHLPQTRLCQYKCLVPQTRVRKVCIENTRSATDVGATLSIRMPFVAQLESPRWHDRRDTNVVFALV